MSHLYDIRDTDEFPDLYIAHVSAMTTERLHKKSEIAAELAWRDKRIAELESEIDSLHQDAAGIDI